VIGERTHPVTDRRISYVACRAIGGQARVVDTDELDAAEWCPVADVEARLTAGVFGPVLTYLRGAVTR
jgi:8-oxo-dGTP diphosphatase